MNEITLMTAKIPIVPTNKNILIFGIVCLLACLGLFVLPGRSLADSQSGLGGSPLPMFGSTFGGSKQPFDPIRSGIRRFASLGYHEADNESDCKTFAYNSNPPTSGLFLPNFIPRNDTEGPISQCTIVNVLYKGNILILYDPKRLDSDTLSEIRRLGTQIGNQTAYMSQEQFGFAVILIRTRTIKTPILFAAWRRTLPMKKWDSLLVNRFMSSYLGNPRKGQETEDLNRK